MHSFFSGNKIVGILGGGQLGKMLLQKATQWDLYTKVLDPSANAPCKHLCTEFVQGDFNDYETVLQFGETCDVITIEIEHVNTQALKVLESKGIKVFPSVATLDMIKDKGKQKQFYTKHNLPTSPYLLFHSKQEVLDALHQQKIKIPFVQKSCTDGYDGKGVVVIDTENDLHKLLDTNCVIEQKIKIKYEISVIVARNEANEIKCYEPSMMVFNEDANLLDLLIYPASIPDKQVNEAKQIAIQLSQLLNTVGVLAVEFFIDMDDHILINEIAPRPHNSGHQTIESNSVSQYEQHLRAILNLPLGNTEIITPSVMINILGTEGYKGNVYYEGLNDVMKQESVSVHIYGKKITKPYRKMGHITICNNDIEQAKKMALWIKQNLIVKSQS